MVTTSRLVYWIVVAWVLTMGVLFLIGECTIIHNMTTHL